MNGSAVTSLTRKLSMPCCWALLRATQCRSVRREGPSALSELLRVALNSRTAIYTSAQAKGARPRHGFLGLLPGGLLRGNQTARKGLPVRHRKRAVDRASTQLGSWLSRLRPSNPIDLYNELLRGAAYHAGGGIAAILMVWIQSRR